MRITRHKNSIDSGTNSQIAGEAITLKSTIEAGEKSHWTVTASAVSVIEECYRMGFISQVTPDATELHVSRFRAVNYLYGRIIRGDHVRFEQNLATEVVQWLEDSGGLRVEITESGATELDSTAIVNG